MPISRKDAALNSLVNFSNLNEEKKDEEEGQGEDYKPLVIDPTKAGQGSGFVPAPIPATDPNAAPLAAIEQAEVPKS